MGDVNPQTEWALEQSGAESPTLLRHIMLRVRDVMKEDLITAHRDDPLRNVGLEMAQRNIGQIPLVDDDGALVGIITERDLARMYVRESREPSNFESSPVSVGAIVEVLEGELLAGEDRVSSGRLWVIARDVGSMGQYIRSGGSGGGWRQTGGPAPGRGARAPRCSSSPTAMRPDDEMLEMAEENGTTVVLSPLDSYVTSRMIQLSVPCWEVMSENPLTVDPDDLLPDITQAVMEVHYRAAIAVDRDNIPLGLVSRTDLVNPDPRRVLLVDHAEVGQSVEGVEQAQVVEILDHHHIGDIETTTPIPATFDPVGSTATLDRRTLQGERAEARGEHGEDAARCRPLGHGRS